MLQWLVFGVGVVVTVWCKLLRCVHCASCCCGYNGWYAGVVGVGLHTFPHHPLHRRDHTMRWPAIVVQYFRCRQAQSWCRQGKTSLFTLLSPCKPLLSLWPKWARKKNRPKTALKRRAVRFVTTTRCNVIGTMRAFITYSSTCFLLSKENVFLEIIT